MAGAPGFEPGNAGTKNRCLTAWRRPKTGLVLRNIVLEMRSGNEFCLAFSLYFNSLCEPDLQKPSHPLDRASPTSYVNIIKKDLSISSLMKRS
jgi:hypothetical protein